MTLDKVKDHKSNLKKTANTVLVTILDKLLTVIGINLFSTFKFIYKIIGSHNNSIKAQSMYITNCIKL